MDAEYLKKNVNVALMESLASMAIAKPDDCVDYIGKYLLQYVERGALKIKEDEKLEKIIALAKEDSITEDLKGLKLDEDKALLDGYNAQLTRFLDSLDVLVTSKQDCLNKCTTFLHGYLEVPAVYVAIKKTVNEIETLYYISSNDSQEGIVIGKKLPKAIDEGDETAPRQGFSFDAFKIPEAPEATDEPEESLDDEDSKGEKLPKEDKVPKGPIPFIIDNVMRDKRTKFFGIPKLGAFAGIPLSINSIDHVEGCQSASGDLHRGPYTMNKVPTAILLCMDTIGKFKSFTPKQIEIAIAVGNKMITIMEKMEEKMFELQVQFFDKQKPNMKTVVELQAKMKDDEDAAVASLVAPDPENELAEIIKTFQEAKARVELYGQKISSVPLQTIIATLDSHIMPVPQIVCNLFYAAGCLAGVEPVYFKDASGDLAWERIRKTLPEFMMKVGMYQVKAVTTVVPEATVSAVKTFCESTGLSDSQAIFPTYFPAFQVVHAWLLRAVAAREAAIAFARDVEQTQIELVQK
eukprot:gene4831-9631_t